MNAALFQPGWGYVQIGVVVAVVYALSCVALRLAGRRIRSHLRPVDLTALLLMTNALSPSLLLDDKGLGAEVVVLATLTACVRITSLVSLRARWRDPSVRRDAVFFEHAATAPRTPPSAPSSGLSEVAGVQLALAGARAPTDAAEFARALRRAQAA